MTNEHLYKAKNHATGEWVIGYYVKDEVANRDYILSSNYTTGMINQPGGTKYLNFVLFNIDPETLCRGVALEHNPLWEHDIVVFDDIYEACHFQNQAVVVYHNGRFELDCFKSDNSTVMSDMNNSTHEDFWSVIEQCRVIGNIFDHPELLSGGTFTLLET